MAERDRRDLYAASPQGVPAGADQPDPSLGYPARRREPHAPGAHGGGRWRLPNWRLRWKLLVVLLVPLITAVGLGALRVVNQLQNADVYNQINRELTVSASLTSVIDNLQREAEQVALYTASGKSAGAGPGGSQTSAVDSAILAFRQQVQEAGTLNPATQRAVQNALASLNDLNAIRSATSTLYPEVAVVNGYNQILTALLNAAQIAQAGATDPGIATITNSLAQLRQAKQFYMQGNAILMMTAYSGRFPLGLENLLRSDDAQFQASVASFNNLASESDRQMFADTFVGGAVDQRASFLATVLTTADSGALATLNPPITPADVQTAGDNAGGLLRTAETRLENELSSSAKNLASAAVNQGIQDGLIVAASLVLAFLITLLVARSLVQSLRRLRSGALDVARSRLPESVRRILDDPDPIRASNEAVEPIPVFTADEIGEVARSFDVVHGQAVRLAAEQAVLRDNVNAIFVNLSRRSQALVERQLALIDRLERDEQDPDNLANLFELDHLATRMRRNSESLLVLSGSGLAKRMSRPVPIGELVGAAVSEVEQYARIEVGSPPDAAVLGRVVNDLIHLIAELLDNATAYSEPNTKVSVRIARTKARELAIQITDRGVGMSEEDIRAANERLANPPDIDVSVTRRMGLYVVARLAKRHSIRIKLRANEDIDGGTVALVVVPEDLVHRPGEEHSPVAGTLGTGTGELPAAVRPGEQAGRPAAATAAAGIAGAFGMAGNRNPNQPNVLPQEFGSYAEAAAAGRLNGFDGQLPGEPAGPIDLADMYWANEAARAANAAPPGANETTQYVRDDERVPPQEASSPDLLWQAHTAAEAGSDRGWQGGDVESTSFNGTVNLDGLYNTGGTTGPSHYEVDAPTERLPIYEAVLSQWFRADRPANGEAGDTPEPAAEPVESGVEGGADGAAPDSTTDSAMEATAESNGAADTSSGGLPTRVPGKAGARMGFTPGGRPSDTAGSSMAGANGHAGTGRGGDDPWHSAADEGWHAAEALLSDQVSETTSAGLPKRVPRAHLVPGSARSPEPLPSPENTLVTAGAPSTSSGGLRRPMLPPRSADAVRGRMSSFQQGLRRGRHALVEGYSGGTSVPSEHQSVEEHE